MPLPPQMPRHPAMMLPPGAAAPPPPDEKESAVTPAMVKAGIAALRSSKGLQPAALVTAIFEAMDALEDEDKDKPPGSSDAGDAGGPGPADQPGGPSGP